MAVRYAQLKKDYRVFEKGDIFQIKFTTKRVCVCHVAYGQTIGIPYSYLERISK